MKKLPQAPSQSLFIKRDASSTEPPSSTSQKSPVDEPSSKFPRWVPSKGALPPGSLHRAPIERERETLHPYSPFQPYL
jgi:hypothetical protein